MKKITLFMVLFLSSYICTNADGMFEIYPPFGERLQYHHLTIDNNSSIDSVNIDLMEKKRKYFENIMTINPYSVLTFSNMNQNQIDSAIRKIDIELKRRFITTVIFDTCTIRELPFSFRDFWGLSSIVFNSCDSINSLNGFNSASSIFTLFFENCKISRLPDGTEKIKSFLRLIIAPPFNYASLDINTELKKFEKRNNVIDLLINYRLLDEFPQTIFNLTSLQNLAVFTLKIKTYIPQYEKLVNLITLGLTDLNDDVFSSSSKIDIIQRRYSSFIRDNPERFFDDVYDYIHDGKWISYNDDSDNIKHIGSITLYRFESKSCFKEKHVINYEDYILNITQDTSNYKRIIIQFSSLNPSDTITGEINYVANYELNYKLTFTKNECEIDFSKFKYNKFNIILQINDKKYSIRIDSEG